MSEPVKHSGRKCPECGNESYIDLEGDEVCYQCGLLIADLPTANGEARSSANGNGNGEAR